MVHITTLKHAVLTMKRKGAQKIVDSLADGAVSVEISCWRKYRSGMRQHPVQAQKKAINTARAIAAPTPLKLLTAATPVKGVGVGARVAVLKVVAVPGEEEFAAVTNGGGGGVVGVGPGEAGEHGVEADGGQGQAVQT